MASLREETVGKMIIDSGATSSLTSVVALEAFIGKMQELGKDHGVTVDPRDKTTFRFGNGARDTTLSRADVTTYAEGRPGTISMACLDTRGRYVPMLASVDFLRKSGAVIDFGRGEAVFRALGTKVVKLESTSSGHYVIDITKDLLKGAGAVGPDAGVGIRDLE